MLEKNNALTHSDLTIIKSAKTKPRMANLVLISDKFPSSAMFHHKNFTCPAMVTVIWQNKSRINLRTGLVAETIELLNMRVKMDKMDYYY